MRVAADPLLTRADVPPFRSDLEDPTSVFNPGATRFRGRELLLLRVQTRARDTLLVPAERHSDGGVTVEPRTVDIEGLADVGETVHHVYDPRLTVLDDVLYVVFAADTDRGCRLGVARTEDFARFALVSFDPSGDRRNGVLFPERIGGRYLRFERPNRPRIGGGPPTGSAVVLAESDDLVSWRETGEVFAGRPRRWDELVGSGPPPVRTRDGWLHVYHGVATHFQSVNVYQAGVVLLDLDDPTRVLGRSHGNVLEPRRPWELMGQVPNVVFPTGLVVDEDGAARLYYGAADTVVGLAETTVDELVAACGDEEESDDEGVEL